MKLTPGLLRLILNLYPPYLGTGVWVERISADWRRTDVSMRLRWYNRNAVKTHFGGSLYAMTDPHLMLMLMQILGPDYVVWDRAASIEFLRPGRGKVSLCLEITDSDLEAIHATLARRKKYLPEFTLDVVDEQDKTVARVKKTLYIRKKS